MALIQYFPDGIILCSPYIFVLILFQHQASMYTIERPNLSYNDLIRLALLSKPNSQATLSQIYDFIQFTYPYYNQATECRFWKNSVRHNLCKNQQFQRIPSNGAEDSGKSFFFLSSFPIVYSSFIPSLAEVRMSLHIMKSKTFYKFDSIPNVVIICILPHFATLESIICSCGCLLNPFCLL